MAKATKRAPREVVETVGRAELVDWLDATGTSQAALASAIGPKQTQAAVSLWVHGLSRPRPECRAAIARITGIAEDHWLTPKERRIASGKSAA